MEAARATTLKAYFASPAKTLRPIMTSLNGDNSWLLSFPRPAEERVATGKVFYHVVFEPWLTRFTQVLNSWIVHIAMPHQPAIQDASGVEAVARQIEAAAAEYLPQGSSIVPRENGYAGAVDAILLGFHYTDHIHEATLRLFDKRIPVIATPEAVAIVKPWGHFETFNLISDLDSSAKSWRSVTLHPGAPLPSWLTPIRLPGHHELNYCLALVWTHTTEDGREIHETVFDSPHGTLLDEGPFQAFLDAEPQMKRLAMMHGMKESWTAWWQTTLGAKGGLAMYRKLGGVKYWMMTHHSMLSYSGFFMRLSGTKDTQRTLEWALEEERKQGSDVSEKKGGTPNLTQVENGGCFVLA